MRNLGFFILSLVFASAAFAVPEISLSPKLQPLFEVLKKIPANYKTEGTACEQAARIEAYNSSYPADRFVITTGVEYDIGDGTLGELDLVVIDKATDKVVLVGEVKCWRSFDSALDKAKYQQDRFLWNLRQYPQKIHFIAHEEGFAFTAEQFSGLNQFVFISQAGGTKKGFDQEIPYTLLEMDEISQVLVRCQKKGQCARP